MTWWNVSCIKMHVSIQPVGAAAKPVFTKLISKQERKGFIFEAAILRMMMMTWYRKKRRKRVHFMINVKVIYLRVNICMHVGIIISLCKWECQLKDEENGQDAGSI